ncbi:uncharacterized protein LOC128239100 [Mya arenaria]|uniref:uncharacterized protein LOC128239100 n=1 Tax=Mya arenaria TaxID=6604 RepID=UPI0022DEE660|nr:uncharacterized protein LOC128239100 [Mya arenaria]
MIRLILFISILFSFVVTDFPFRNVSLPFDQRVDDVVSRLTIKEIIEQMSRGGGGGDGGPVLPIERLGIGKYWWSTECVHGDAVANTTAFPQSIGLSAMFNPSLLNEVASAISIEVRAKNNDYVKRGIFTSHTGLSCFSPVINIMRHPLWGRNQETYGEDPYMSGILARAFVTGLIGDNKRYYRANAVCKHFDAYNGPEDLPQSRLSFNAQVADRDLFSTFLPQFKDCIDSGALGVMCSYNSLNGIPACANKRLLTDILRKNWNFTGFVISDSGALEFIILNHRYTLNIEDAAVMSVTAGVNLELHAGQLERGVFDWLNEAVSDGKVSEDLLRERVKPLFYTRMRLGEFDPPSLNPYLKIDLSVIQSPAHRELATKAAMQSFVLLKNEGLLPLRKTVDTLAIVGPFADNPVQQTGNYAPGLDPLYTSTVKSGLKGLGKNVVVETGCKDSTLCLHYEGQKVQDAVRNADLVVVCLGTGIAIETEDFDRNNMLLPGYQLRLLQDAVNFAHGKVILLLFSAGPLDIRWAAHNPGVWAIIHCFFPAQATGVALYNVLINKTPDGNPAGRLPFTWYSSDEQVPSMVDYSMKNKTYRYFDGDPLYPFGYGLSYTKFRYSNLSLTPMRVKAGSNVTATFDITNVGPISGLEVFQVYISWMNATVPTPKYQLVNFNRTTLAVGQTKTLSAEITNRQMEVYIDGKGFVIEPGEIAVYVGGQLPEQKTKVPSNVLRSVFTIYR